MSYQTNRRNFLISLGSGTIVAGLSGMQVIQAQYNSPKPLLRFAVASDGHYGQPNTNYQMFHRELVAWINDEKTGKGLDFMVFNGDLVANRPDLFPELKTYFDQLTTPYYVVKGNHDTATDKQWTSFWGTAPNHSFELNAFGFICAYTSNVDGDYICADRAWIKAELDKYNHCQGIYVFMHIPQSDLSANGISCPETENLLCETEKVKAVFLAHEHDLDNKLLVHKKPFFFDGHFGGNWGTNYRGYRIVEVYEDKTITYQCNPNAFYVNKTSF